MRGSEALAYLRRRRRKNRLGESNLEDLAYRVEIILLPIGAIAYIGWFALTQNPIGESTLPDSAVWLISSLLAIYGVARVLSAIAIGPVRLDPAEAELVASAPIPVRRFMLRHLVNALAKEIVGAIAVSALWSIQAYASFGADFVLVFPLTLAGLLPYVAAVVACAWIVENAPGFQRAVKNLVPRLAWIPILIVVASPLLVRLLVDTGSSPASRWWGPWAWAVDPGLRALDGTVDLTGMYLGLALAAIVWVFAVVECGSPAYVTIEARSRLRLMRQSLRAFQDSIGLHDVRRQLWSPDRVRVGGRFRIIPARPPRGRWALVWKSARHLTREGTGSWVLPTAAFVATGAAALYTPPFVAIGLGLVVIYVGTSRLLTPVLADLQADAITSQLPFDAWIRVTAAISTSAVVVVASAWLAVVSLWIFTDMSALFAGVAFAALPLIGLVALGSALFGTLPSKLDITAALPPEFWVLGRYQAPMLWITFAAIAIAPNMWKPVLTWTFTALGGELVIVWALVVYRYGEAMKD